MVKQKHIKLAQLIYTILLATKNALETILGSKHSVMAETSFDLLDMIASSHLQKNKYDNNK